MYSHDIRTIVGFDFCLLARRKVQSIVDRCAGTNKISQTGNSCPLLPLIHDLPYQIRKHEGHGMKWNKLHSSRTSCRYLWNWDWCLDAFIRPRRWSWARSAVLILLWCCACWRYWWAHGTEILFFFFLKSIGGRSRNVPFVYKDEALSPRCYLLFSVFLLPSTSSTTSFSQRYLLSISYKAYLSEQKNRGVARSDISLRRIFLKEIHPLKRQSLHHESYKSHIRGDRHRLCSCWAHQL